MEEVRYFYPALLRSWAGRVLVFVWLLSLCGVGYVVFLNGAEPDWQTKLFWFLSGAINMLAIVVAPTIVYQTERLPLVITINVVSSFSFFGIATYFNPPYMPYTLIVGVAGSIVLADVVGKWSRGIRRENVSASNCVR